MRAAAERGTHGDPTGRDKVQVAKLWRKDKRGGDARVGTPGPWAGRSQGRGPGTFQVAAAALQIHGEYGYMKGSEIERKYRDCRVFTIFEGSSQIQQMIISGQMLR